MQKVFFTSILIELLWNFENTKTLRKLIFFKSLVPHCCKSTPFFGQIEPKCVHSGHILVQYGHIPNLLEVVCGILGS